jgi:hypothetical protein
MCFAAPPHPVEWTLAAMRTAVREPRSDEAYGTKQSALNETSSDPVDREGAFFVSRSFIA